MCVYVCVCVYVFLCACVCMCVYTGACVLACVLVCAARHVRADDLYSVGIVLFEMLHLFKTWMHRVTVRN